MKNTHANEATIFDLTKCFCIFFVGYVLKKCKNDQNWGKKGK